jgi:hypothetical protein
MTDDLFEAYARTNFWVELPSVCHALRVRKLHEAFDQFLGSTEFAEWAYITAYNPMSRRLSDEENQRRQRDLVATVKSLGLQTLTGLGVPDDPGWQPEPSILILGISRDDAKSLGRDYEQRAIVNGKLCFEAELVECANE